ncbi:hypothetical protein L3X38_016159 [Prunus dulcis]|uniref:Uncharacterized protein n=1 Tax=Prunus dulcis TaxID=3755 RepID=A0AAD4W4T6_PRUDU|nr:hypothetical protein L3X38_016159 [Prunus dulcis]
MVGSMNTRGKAAAMARSATAQSHSTHDPAIDMVASPPLTTAPATAAEHGGTSHQGGLVTTADPGPVLEQLQAFPSLPPRATHAPAYTSNENLARVQLGSTHFSPPDPRSQADVNLRVDQLAQRMDDQSNLMRQLINQISIAQNLGLGQPGEERRLDERAGGQLDVRACLGPQGNVHQRLGSQGNIHQRLGPQGGQPNNHCNEDREERRSAIHSQRSVLERLGPQEGQLDNPHNEDHEERRSVTHSRGTNSRRQATENLSQAQSTNTPTRHVIPRPQISPNLTLI